MATVGEVIEFDAMPTRARGILRWIARCSMHDDTPSERLVPRIIEIQQKGGPKHMPPVAKWGLYRWAQALGYNEGGSPGSYVRKALVLAGIENFDYGPTVYRWDFEAGKYRLVTLEVRRA